MAETVVVSGRGQITIPADMRKRLGIESGGTMTIEETSGGLLLKPSIQIFVDCEVYSDEDIARWDEEDRLDKGERDRLLESLGATGESGQG
jgi:antitoxin PrlF